MQFGNNIASGNPGKPPPVPTSKIEVSSSKEINFASPFVELPHKLTVLQNLTVFGHIYGVKNLSYKIEKLAQDFNFSPIFLMWSWFL